MPKAPAVKRAGKRITAPPANMRQSMSIGAAKASSTVAVILAAPQVILKANLIAPKKNQRDNAVIKISNIAFLLEISAQPFGLRLYSILFQGYNK